MKKILFIALVLGAASFVMAGDKCFSATECKKCEVTSAQEKGYWWDCPRCSTMNSVSEAYCTNCGMRKR